MDSVVFQTKQYFILVFVLLGFISDLIFAFTHTTLH